jgi:hypothetical protein
VTSGKGYSPLGPCNGISGDVVLLKPQRTTVAFLNLNDYARIGAQVRLSELQSEIDAILAAYPDLRSAGPAPQRSRPVRKSARAAENAGQRRRRRKGRPMSAAKRREVSERMKKYWAQRRKAAAKSG